MRAISFSMTPGEIRDRSKTVTRRQGWLNLKVGDELQAVEKAMGLRKGEKRVKLAVIRVVDVRREPLDAITDQDVAREGFPHLSAPEFVDLYCEAMGCGPFDECTRIEFEYVEATDKQSIASEAGGEA